MEALRLLQPKSARAPQEVVDMIVDHLHDDLDTLKQCSLVCRDWVPSSSLHLFHTFQWPIHSITAHQLGSGAEPSEGLVRLLEVSPRVRNNVRHLAFRHIQHETLTFDALLRVLRLASRVDSLELSLCHLDVGTWSRTAEVLDNGRSMKEIHIFFPYTSLPYEDLLSLLTVFERVEKFRCQTSIDPASSPSTSPLPSGRKVQIVTLDFTGCNPIVESGRSLCQRSSHVIQYSTLQNLILASVVVFDPPLLAYLRNTAPNLRSLSFDLYEDDGCQWDELPVLEGTVKHARLSSLTFSVCSPMFEPPLQGKWMAWVLDNLVGTWTEEVNIIVKLYDHIDDREFLMYYELQWFVEEFTGWGPPVAGVVERCEALRMLRIVLKCESLEQPIPLHRLAFLRHAMERQLPEGLRKVLEVMVYDEHGVAQEI